METGQEILDRALQLLGYADGCGADENSPRWQALLDRGLAAVNQAYSDLWFLENDGVFTPLTALSEQVLLSSRGAGDILPYGVAMFLAQSEGDGDNQRLYASLYNQKRASAARRPRRRQDTLFGREDVCGL